MEHMHLPPVSWHRASFDRLIHDSLPQLLAEHLPLAAYRAEEGDAYSVRLTVSVAQQGGDVSAVYTLPRPDADGVFYAPSERERPFVPGRGASNRLWKGEWPRIVVPIATAPDLETAEIRCFGEQLYDFIAARLGTAAPGLPWDEHLLRTWLPLETWTWDFIHTSHSVQWLDLTNRLATFTHLRRLVVPQRERVIAPAHFGRVCPFETPDGPNIGHVFSLARGAEIRDGRLIIVDDRPEAALGLTASTVPFLEHNDPNRQLFGVNMLRQWIPAPEVEPALVQTGNEPLDPHFWCGFNLLTAFVALGEETFEDGLVMSESCARRLPFDLPLAPGDKLSNRHGAKGVISRIAPDAEMPCLPDGTPVDLVYSFVALHARLNFGQAREAVMSRIARAEGAPVIVPPFHAPDEEALRARLVRAGLPEDGMEQLTLCGQPLDRRSLVGWVYWGRTEHIAADKIHASVTPAGSCQRQGELEYLALRDVGAGHVLHELFNTLAAERPDAAEVAAQVAMGPLEPAGPPAPHWAEVVRRLDAAGIRAELRDDRLAFRFAPPSGERLTLAHPVPHPWLRDREVREIGVLPEVPGFGAVEEANARLARLLEDDAPASLRRRAIDELIARVDALFDNLLTPAGIPVNSFSPPERMSLLRPSTRVLFSGRTVLAPGCGLRPDELGLADDIAWALFGPLAARDVGAAAVTKRSADAAQALDAVMARMWVILNRAPTFMPTALLAFRPVRIPEQVIRLHPLACMLMNADFDGDQAAVFLPLTEAAQREAGELLTIAGHLRRDPALLEWLCPSQEPLWGLAWLSRSPEGRREVAEMLGTDAVDPAGYVTRASLTEALRAILQREGVDAELAMAERLMHRGFAVARRTGASLHPFIGASLDRPAPPEGDGPEAWRRAAEEIAERLAAWPEMEEADFAPQLLAVKCGARGTMQQLVRLLGPRGAAVAADGTVVPVRHGSRDGLTPAELFAATASEREGLLQTALECGRMGYGAREAHEPRGYAVLARARRAAYPGLVFAHAAAMEEIDPLADADSRLFVGFPP